MRQILLIILGGIHFFGNTEISQAFKIFNLVDHYFERCRIDPRIGFFEFLSMHYVGDNGTDADNDKDDQLPYHNINHHTFSVICFKIQKVSSGEIISSDKANEYILPLLAYFPQEHIFSFFKPPRIA